jgi:dTDP-4-amino-4,6-dideoxygalactose transaminase
MWENQVIARMCLYKKYRDSLEVASGKTIEFQADTGIFAPSLFCMRMRSRAMRDDLELVLARENIQTRRWYLPLLQHQLQLKSIEVLQPTPNALLLAETLLGLPFFVDMTDAEFEKVCRVILDFAKIK